MLNRPEEPLSGGWRVLTGARACAIVEFLIMKPSFICSIALLTVSLSSALFAQTRFDLLLQGGHVIDAKNGISAIVVLDTRSEAHYAAGHIPGAINFPHRLMSEESTRTLDRSKTYVTYCDGIGCNGSTKGAYKLAKNGLRVKEMLGGLDFWIRDGFPLATGPEPGALTAGDTPAIVCSC